MSSRATGPCELCAEPRRDALLVETHGCRVLLVDDPDYPGYCRVILARHAAEMTDLDQSEARAVLHLVLAVERAVRDVVAPDKVNLASLGNQVPHLHWHVIPRWRDDRCFPRPIWAEPLRDRAARAVPADLAARLRAALLRVLAPDAP